MKIAIIVLYALVFVIFLLGVIEIYRIKNTYIKKGVQATTQNTVNAQAGDWIEELQKNLKEFDLKFTSK